MRHFAHHIGDYAAATAHLSFVEDAAYHRLLRLYYRDERPLPSEVAACQRLAGARTKEERAAVETVLREFFTVEADGWHQTRADNEISGYQARADIARENGQRGGRPKTQGKPSRLSEGSGREPDEKLTNNQEPVTNNQERKTRAKARQSCIPDDWKPDDALIDYAKAQGCKDPHDTFERFRLHHAGKGTLHKDWTLAAQYWTRNEKNFAPRGGSGPTRPTMQTATSFPTKEDWDWKVKWHREKGMWKPDWGPEPGQPGCFVPKELLQ